MNECPKKESKSDICPRRKEFSYRFSKGRWTSQTRARPWWTGSRWFNMERKQLATTMRTKLRWFTDRMNQRSLGFSKQNMKRTSSTAALWKWRRQPQTPRREQSIGRDLDTILRGVEHICDRHPFTEFNTCCEWYSFIEDGWSCGGWTWDLVSTTLSIFETWQEPNNQVPPIWIIHCSNILRLEPHN